MICVPDDVPPSASVRVIFTTQSPSTFDHDSSPNEPSESNDHERMRLARGSQPMTCVPSCTCSSSFSTLYERIRNAFFAVQCTEVSTRTPSALSRHCPTKNSKSLRASAAVGGVGVSLSCTLSISHVASAAPCLISTAENDDS